MPKKAVKGIHEYWKEALNIKKYKEGKIPCRDVCIRIRYFFMLKISEISFNTKYYVYGPTWKIYTYFVKFIIF